MTLLENTNLQGGKYRIIRFLSSGGFGCTYEAVHVMLGKRVAIKEFFVKDYCNRDETTYHVTVGTQSKKPLVDKLKKKFIEEAVALSQFNHPNIIKVFDVFEENETAYYVMEYIEGDNLAKIIKKKGCFSEQDTIGIVKQVCSALSYIHSKNRLHLDIKPSNIMARTDGDVVLIDFGTSKQYDEEAGENTSTLTGKTPGFAPIEQMGNCITKFTPSTDIYSLGATMVKMLTGKTPPDATILEEEGIPPLPHAIAKSTVSAISVSLQSRRSDRPQTISEFLDYLDGRKQFLKKIKEESKTEHTILDKDANKKRIEDKRDIDGLTKRISEYESKLVQADSANEMLKEELKKSKMQVRNLENQVESLEKEKEDAKNSAPTLKMYKEKLEQSEKQVQNLENQVEILEEEKEDARKSIPPLIWIVMIVLSVVCISLMSTCSSDSQTITKLNQELSKSQSDLSTSKSELNNLKSIVDKITPEYPFIVTSFEVKNEGENYGDPIVSKNTTYLYPKLNIISLMPSGDYEFKFKLIAPYGLTQGKTSPKGYSFSRNQYLKQYQTNTVEFQGWGNEEKGYWGAGNYKYEIYYQNKCIGKYEFKIK